jgi:hypothetical protein
VSLAPRFSRTSAGPIEPLPMGTMPLDASGGRQARVNERQSLHKVGNRCCGMRGLPEPRQVAGR